MTPKEITLKAKTCVARMAAANGVLHMLGPKIVKDSEDMVHTEHVVKENGEVKMTPIIS